MKQQSTKITFAYSPDTDDAFMVAAIKNKNIDLKNYEFEFFRGDIQELNEKALHGVYDISAASAAMYPDIQNEYELMSMGSSIGDQFGPAVVVPLSSPIQNIFELEGKKIAVPGLKTSAMCALSHIIKFFSPASIRFDQIGEVVLRGEVDAGILIHELQIDFENCGLRKIADLGKLWFEKTHLPLPLGINVIRKALPEHVKKDLCEIYEKSIDYGLKNRDVTLKNALLDTSGKNLTWEKANQYIDMYVNHRSLTLHRDVKEAMKLMHEINL